MALNPYAATLMAQGGGLRRRTDPLEHRFSFGQKLIQSGSSTEPVRSPLEGLARALQAGIGGWVASSASDEARERDRKTVGAYAKALAAKDDAELKAALADVDLDPETVAPLFGQMLANR